MQKAPAEGGMSAGSRLEELPEPLALSGSAQPLAAGLRPLVENKA